MLNMPNSEILDAITELRRDVREDILQVKGELSASFTDGLSRVNIALASLAEAHHAARLEQERRNADFASRQVVTDVERRAMEMLERIAALDARVHSLERCVDELQRADEDAARRFNEQVTRQQEQATHLFSGALGYVVMGLISMASGALGAVVSHLVR